MQASIQPAFAAGFESAAQAAVLAGTLVLGLMIVALVAFAYKSLNGGIEWPSDKDEMEPTADGNGVNRGGDDDEWKYY